MEAEKPSQQAYIALALSIAGCLGCGGCFTGILGAIMGMMSIAWQEFERPVSTKVANAKNLFHRCHAM